MNKRRYLIFFLTWLDDQGEEPYIRIRLEATWKKSEILPQGEVEVKLTL